MDSVIQYPDGDIYRIMITDSFVRDLHGINMNAVYFQQGDATCHTSHAAIDLLRQTFDGRLISRNGDVN